jgi:hypothetical protein
MDPKPTLPLRQRVPPYDRTDPEPLYLTNGQIESIG